MFVRIGPERYVNLATANQIILQQLQAGWYITIHHGDATGHGAQGPLDLEQYNRVKSFLDRQGFEMA